jgi:hypothetical protein
MGNVASSFENGALVRVYDVWRGFADERRLHLRLRPNHPDPCLRSRAHDVGMVMTGRYDGIEIAIGAFHPHGREAHTSIRATPRFALHGTVRVRPGRGWELRRPWPAAGLLDRSLVVRRSSESVARAVLDERVTSTIRQLGRRLIELAYSAEAIELRWQDVECSTVVLEDAVACVAHLAVRATQTPYR